MRKKIGLLLVLALLLPARYWFNIAQYCSDLAHKRQVVEIYAIDMRYACGGCATYRILQLENNQDDKEKLKDKAWLTSQERDRIIPDNFYTLAEDEHKETLRADGKALPGREFYVKFTDRMVEKRFDEQNRWSACYIYWFKGYPKINLIPDGENYVMNHFIASGYKIIRDAQCEAQWSRDAANTE